MILMGFLLPVNLAAIPRGIRDDHRQEIMEEVEKLINTMKEWNNKELVDIYLKLRDNGRWDLMTDLEFGMNNQKLNAMFYEIQQRGII